MPPYKLFSTARSYSLGLIKYIFYTTGYILPLQFYTCISNSPILCFINLHLYLYFLGSHLYKYKSFFIFYPQFHQIQHNFHRHTLCQQHEAITSLFDLTFRDYCGIKLLLGHQYGSHYLYLNLKNRL